MEAAAVSRQNLNFGHMILSGHGCGMKGFISNRVAIIDEIKGVSCLTSTRPTLVLDNIKCSGTLSGLYVKAGTKNIFSFRKVINITI